MGYRVFTAVLFGIFLFVALLGLPVFLSHAEHGTMCPLMGAQAALCDSTILEHFSLWQAMFVSVLGAFALMLGIAVYVVAGIDVSFVQERIRIRLCARATRRPALLQELFSRGILNRKEPYLFS